MLGHRFDITLNIWELINRTDLKLLYTKHYKEVPGLFSLSLNIHTQQCLESNLLYSLLVNIMSVSSDNGKVPVHVSDVSYVETIVKRYYGTVIYETCQSEYYRSGNRLLSYKCILFLNNKF
jgi:hypothetical protein